MDADWSNGNWLFPRAVRLLDVEFYRHAVLQGLITSLGSKTESTVSDLLRNATSDIDVRN